MTSAQRAGDKAEARIKYFVEIHRSEEQGGLKTVKFQTRRPALEFAERQHTRGFPVVVMNKDGKKIYERM